MSENDPLPTYDEHQQFENEFQVKRAGAMIRRSPPTQETPTPPEFVLVMETQYSDRPPLHLRIDGDCLRSLVGLVSPYLAPSRQEHHQILAALDRIEKKLDDRS